MQKFPTLVFGGNYGPDVDHKRWVVIYPPYIDKLRTDAQGRKIGKEKCVEKPSIKEIFDCAQLLKFQTALELDKAYCRDYMSRGRVRVRLFDDDKKPIREDIPSRRVLYARVAQLIPEHRERTKALEKKKGNAGRGGGGKGGKGSGSKQQSGKGAPAPQKKKKKGKR